MTGIRNKANFTPNNAESPTLPIQQIFMLT